MNRFFRRLPLLGKLALIGLIPLGFLIYLTVQLYQEKAQKVKLLERQMERIAQSASINALIDNLQEERKYSFDYAMTGGMRTELVQQRPQTDALIRKLQSSRNEDLSGFTIYTKLNQLPNIRNRIDSGKADPNTVMHYYSNMVFRLNTLNTIPSASNGYLQPVHRDLIAQKLLSEMMTYLGIIRSNIYNVLHTRKYMVETLMGTVGTHDVFQSYEQEFLLKAPPEVVQQYKNIRSQTSLKPTLSYIDTLFRRFSFDSTYDAQNWWVVSNKGIDELRALQKGIWQRIHTKVQALYENERSAKNLAVFFLILSIVLVVFLVAYTVHIINSMLHELKKAAEKLAKGASDVSVAVYSNDVIGSLAYSISKIDTNNKILADAAIAIGKGNYDVAVEPRSRADVLGNALVEMKKELQQYSRRMETLVQQRTEELNRSNADLQQFAHVASHDLKEPLRKIQTFSSRLSQELQSQPNGKDREYLAKIQQAAQRMSNLIEGILQYSLVSATNQAFEPIDLNALIAGIRDDLEVVIAQKNAVIRCADLPRINGIPVLIHQLFYNLINNALKFSKEGVAPEISITAKSVSREDLISKREHASFSDYVEIAVCDNGIGFDQQYAEQMFQAFTRLNTRNRYEGTGLGLALCQKIVQRHEGFIYAEGKEGTGACFYVLLPQKIKHSVASPSSVAV